jgi:hypothetical protein
MDRTSMWATLRNDSRILPAILTAAVGAWVCWLGYGMPVFGSVMSFPGLFPMIIGVGLILMAFALLLERRKLNRAAAAQHGEQSLLEERMEEAAAELALSPAARTRTILTTLAIVAYAVSLAYTPFEVSTAIYLAVAMYIFGERSPLRIVLISVGTTAVLAFAFVYALQTLLPGTSSIVDFLLFG